MSIYSWIAKLISSWYSLFEDIWFFDVYSNTKLEYLRVELFSNLFSKFYCWSPKHAEYVLNHNKHSCGRSAVQSARRMSCTHTDWNEWLVAKKKKNAFLFTCFCYLCHFCIFFPVLFSLCVLHLATTQINVIHILEVFFKLWLRWLLIWHQRRLNHFLKLKDTFFCLASQERRWHCFFPPCVPLTNVFVNKVL